MLDSVMGSPPLFVRCCGEPATPRPWRLPAPVSVPQLSQWRRARYRVGRRGLWYRLTHHNPKSMRSAVVDQRDGPGVDPVAVQDRLCDAAVPTTGIFHGDLVEATPMAPPHHEAVPCTGNARCH